MAEPPQGSRSLGADCRTIATAGVGNPGDVRPIGEGLSELRIHYGPGYRIYLVWRGPEIVVLLGGGTKRGQDRDIAAALRLARDLRE